MSGFWPWPRPAPARSANYVSEYTSGLEFLENLDGIDWYHAPRPPKRHACWPQTRGFMLGGRVERCACGAISRGDGYWMERNSATVRVSR